MSHKKRTIDAFFGGIKSSDSHDEQKKPRKNGDTSSAPSIDGGELKTTSSWSDDSSYPSPIPHLPPSIRAELSSWPSSLARAITANAQQPDLDLLYFEPYLPRSTAGALFRFLRDSLPFYRVEYDIQRGGISTHIRTPRWTTVFGIDETSRFQSDPQVITSAPLSSSSSSPCKPRKEGAAAPPASPIIDSATGRLVIPEKERFYSPCRPRPIPACLDDLRKSAEASTGCRFNFCLVNYYASGSDSISYHSDDERFLGPEPAIASFSLGARRDFLLKHKPPPQPRAQNGQQNSSGPPPKQKPPLKFPLGSGDMILMRGPTQANWLHSIPKRSGKNEDDGGRINITFRRAMVKAGTENYYHYNVGTGPIYRWDAAAGEMRQEVSSPRTKSAAA